MHCSLLCWIRNRQHLVRIERKMCRFTALTAILVTIALGSHGHPTVDIRDESRDYPNEVDNCKNFHQVAWEWNKCISLRIDYSWLTSADKVLGVVEYTCRNRSAITACMTKKFGECSTWSTIQSMMGVSFEFCNGNDIPSNLRTFLEINAGNTVQDLCIESAFEGRDDVCTEPPSPDNRTPTRTLEGLRDVMEGYLNWHVACFKRMPGLDQTLDDCNHMTRRTVFALLISSVSSTSIGVNFYTIFEDMEQQVTPNLVEQVEQFVARRSLFYAN